MKKKGDSHELKEAVEAVNYFSKMLLDVPNANRMIKEKLINAKNESFRDLYKICGVNEITKVPDL